MLQAITILVTMANEKYMLLSKFQQKLQIGNQQI